MSKGFTFRLDTVLQQRVREEEAVQVELARMIQGHKGAQEQLDAMQEAFTTLAINVTPQGEVVNLDACMNALYYRDQAAQAMDQQRSVITQWEQEVDRVRQLLLQAAHRRRALQRLRERREREFNAEMQRRMNLEADELVTSRYKLQAGVQTYAH